MQVVVHGQKPKKNLSPELALYIKENINTLQDLIIVLNNKKMPPVLYSQLFRFSKAHLCNLIIITKRSTALPKGKTNYKFTYDKHLNFTGVRQGKLSIKDIYLSISSVRKQELSAVKPVNTKPKEESLVTDSSLNLNDIKYGTSKWFDTYYSDAYWSPNDIKLGLD